jgi:hypothetical protein
LSKQQTVGFIELEERYAGYKVYDRDGEKIGKVDIDDQTDNNKRRHRSA